MILPLAEPKQAASVLDKVTWIADACVIVVEEIAVVEETPAVEAEVAPEAEATEE